MLTPQHKQIRIFGSDWTLDNVAKLLRANAREGRMRSGTHTGIDWEIHQNYLRETAARHIPSGMIVTLRRDATNTWHAELWSADWDYYLPWNDLAAEQWLTALFLDDRPHVREEPPAETPAPKHFRRYILRAT